MSLLKPEAVEEEFNQSDSVILRMSLLKLAIDDILRDIAVPFPEGMTPTVRTAMTLYKRLLRAFGVRFPKNFNPPYTATSITDFWRRWHITLSRWMGRYLYLPIGGNQMSPSRNFLNLWIVFVVSGFWHGAAWNFLLWGCFHGFFISMDKYLKTLQLAVKIHWSAKQMITFFIVFNSWVLFRANNVTEAFQVYKRMYINFDSSFHNPFWLVFTPHQITVFLFAISIAIVPWRRVNLAYNLGIQFYRMTNLSLCLSLVLILICTSFIFANNTDNFLYFRF